ncbi:MAG: fatty acid desaturase [Gemmatimonadales bacterium]|nr:fatty acid desaturase [Gemmatimonadales bacterium]
MSTKDVVSTKWRELVIKYQQPSTKAAVTQILTTFIPLVAGLVLMALAMKVHYGLVLLLAIPTGGLLVRIFIVMHDCGHGSFFRSRRLNDIFGFITGCMTFTPYIQWRRDHAVHHASSGNLEKRGVGDIATLTVKEYEALSRWGRFKYRIYRNPLILLVFGPVWLVIKHRLPTPGVHTTKKEKLNVWLTNATLVAVGIVLAMFGVLGEAAAIYLPAFLVAGSAGVWLFYVQHQFEDTYWRPAAEWDYATSALKGSSYLKLPRVLQWFSGNIGLHHVHHLSPRIPNYRLQQAHDEQPELQNVPTISFWEGLKALRLRLWDEENMRLIGFREFRERQAALRSN